jgi:hypothetical protein
MKNMFKSLISPIYYLFVDKYAYTSLTPYFKRVLYSFRYKFGSLSIFFHSNEKTISKFKDKHLNERCFIIGNGPSLNKLDLTKLKNEVTFGVNAIYLNYDKMQFHPTYYVVEDNLVAEDRKDEINSYKGPKQKFFGNFLRYCIEPGKDVAFLNLIRNYSDKNYKPFFSNNAVRKVGVGGSVTYVCLQLAYYMGFKEVYMIGFDHNYVIPDSAKISNKNSHSFDITSTEDDVNHFNKDYFGKGYRWHDPNVERMEQGFAKARDIFANGGRVVYNATEGGNLNVLNRVNYNSLF